MRLTGSKVTVQHQLRLASWALHGGDIADSADGTDRAEPGWVDGEAIGGMMVR